MKYLLLMLLFILIQSIFLYAQTKPDSTKIKDSSFNQKGDPNNQHLLNNIPDSLKLQGDEYSIVDEEPMVDLDDIAKAVKYPDKAKMVDCEGRVKLRVLVSRFGYVTKVRIMECDCPMFIESAINAVKSVKFVPATKDGKVTECWVCVPVDFKLK
ncbi:MAG: energy transducer TonB [FCB group bacterium]|jgi:TonB family protein